MAIPSGWVAPVTDRTEADVAQRTAKGVLEAADLNRIEGNSLALAGYFGLEGLDAYTGWQAGSLVFGRDIRRVLAGLAAVRAAAAARHPAAVAGWLPGVPGALAGWGQVNDAERIQLRALRGGEGNGEDFAYTGEAVLGQGTGVV